MKASVQNPEYTIAVISTSQSTKYDISGAIENLELEEREGQIAACATIQIMNAKVNNVQLYDAINVRDRVYIYADDGKQKEEVFRGFVWTKQYKESLQDRTLQIKCYDQLIYFQESEESEFFGSGQSTQSVIQSICNNWGIQLNYSYQSITHSKLVLRGTLSDIFMSDILDLVKDRTGVQYVILSTKDVMQIKSVGQNTTAYVIETEKNALDTENIVTMDGMITQVKILGKAEDSERRPVEATVAGDTAKYGTLQKLIDRDENTALADAKQEAENIIKKDGKPKQEYNVSAPDVPWIRKGDQVSVNAGGISKMLIVKGITHQIKGTEKKMSLTLVNPETT